MRTGAPNADKRNVSVKVRCPMGTSARAGFAFRNGAKNLGLTKVECRTCTRRPWLSTQTVELVLGAFDFGQIGWASIRTR